MAIKRYYAKADNTITNAFKANLTIRATGSNAGLADSLEVFNIHQQASSASIEQARVLVDFPVNEVASDRSASVIAGSGSTSFYLKMYNVKHSQTLPRDFTLQIFAVSQSWSEGLGVDLDEYTDIDASNWMSSSNTTLWAMTGASAHTGATDVFYTASFTNGYEDLEVNVTDMVEYWLKGTYPLKNNYGFLLKMSGAIYSRANTVGAGEGVEETLYTKKFSARSSEFFFKRPTIEARWDSRTSDDRGNFYYSSSLASEPDNLNTLYLYNIIRGRLRNIPNLSNGGRILVSLYSSSANGSPTGSYEGGRLTIQNPNTNTSGGLSLNVTGGLVPGKTGIYTASVAITAASTPLLKLLNDVHFVNASTMHVLSITNLKSKYYTHETARFRVFTREKNWSPTIYSKASEQIKGTIIQSASYSIYRTVDDITAIPYLTGSKTTNEIGSGSVFGTFLSYDYSGSFFDLDMSLLESGYQYAIKFSFYNDSIGDWQEQPYKFKFRVEKL